MLQTVINTLCSHAKWKMPQQNTQGQYTFFLDNNVEFSLFSPNGQDCIFLVKIADIPHGNEGESFIQNIAAKAAGMYKIKKSIVSIRDNAVYLHRLVLKQEINQERILQTAKEILNDADIWHTALTHGSSQNSPFSFSMAGMKF
jgi:hypothetical protein